MNESFVTVVGTHLVRLTHATYQSGPDTGQTQG